MILGGGELLFIGGAIKWGLDLYSNWTTVQTLIFGDPVKKQVDELLAAEQKQEAQLQQINDQLLYAANRDSVHWIKPAANVPQDLAPSADELATIAAPVQTIVTAFSGGTPQPLLGSALIALPPSFYINPAEFVNYNFIDFFIEDGDWPPLAPEQIWVISKNPRGGAYHIGGLNRSRLTKRGLGLHQQWQPNLRVLPVHLRVKENAIRRIVGLPPLPPVPASGKVFSHKLKSGGQGPEMVMLPAGKFRMGGKDKDKLPIHEVTIAKEFAIGKYQITFADYDAFCTATKRELPKDEGWGRDRRPVINISWDDAVAYCIWLSAQTGHTYRLPSEAEWEYACRAGTTTEYSCGDDVNKLGDYAWFSGNSDSKTHPVGEKQPNPWGLYDMHGNVWEWCQDKWHGDYTGAPTDGSAWEAGGSNNNSRLLRGGSWLNTPDNCRSAGRYNDYSHNNLGVRVVAVVSP